MKPEEKDLFLKDLSARLPHHVKVSVNGSKEPWTLKGMFEGEHTGMMLILEPSFPSKDVSPQTSNWQLSQCKPYLRPMSSMTEEEYDEMFQQLYSAQEEFFRNCSNTDTIGKTITYDLVRYDWLNKNMFDYRGLIPKDLALSTEVYNPYKD